MIARFATFIYALTLASLSQAAEKKDQGRYLAIPIKGDYYVYGGSMADMVPPTPKDRKISFMFTGQLAKDLFSEIGPDAKQGCTSAASYHERRRGDLVCIHDETGYSCYLGLDVPKGKSTNGVIC